MPDIFVEKNPKKDIKTENKPSVHNKTEHKTHQKEAENKNETKSPVKEKDLNEQILDSTKTITTKRSELLDNLGIKHQGGTIHAFSSYCETPSSVDFANELEEEFLLLFLRQHFLTNLPWILKTIGLAFIPIIFELFGAFGFYSTEFVSIYGKFVMYFFYYFFIFSGYIFVNYMTWFYNISLVTNLRVVDIDFSDIVFENVAATKFPQLEDVSYSQIGIIRSIFDYGDVFVQTAASARNFEFLSIPHPENVIRIVNNLLGKKRHD